ncbi:hypothetical protein BDZ89DRAFT_1063922 [Hymenopellis radicata]|nr:hypothetical protein BDZ89DRAFT_1063922 [Hymenopellis radicata]
MRPRSRWLSSCMNRTACYTTSPTFFASVGANPDVSLLLVKYHRTPEHGAECFDLPGQAATVNVKEVCLSFEKYWDMHAEWLCGRWGGCADGGGISGKEHVKAKMKDRANGDFYNGFFRPFRASIFSAWIDPSTPIWGASDVDEMWGRCARCLPWDIAPQFDVLVPTAPSWADDILVFTPGHMMFYRHSDDVVRELMNMPHVRDMDSFMQDPFLSHISEEVEWSHFTLLNANLSFVTFPAMVHQSIHVSTLDGVFGFDGVDTSAMRKHQSEADALVPLSMTSLEQRNDLIQAVRTWRATHQTRSRATFSSEGQEYTVALHDGEFPGGLWFPKEFSVHYQPDYGRAPKNDMRRYLMRRAPNGVIVQRVEPMPPAHIQVAGAQWTMVEGLYNHFQSEKYQPYWDLPVTAIGTHEYLFMEKETGIEIWDAQGGVTFSSVLPVDEANGGPQM